MKHLLDINDLLVENLQQSYQIEILLTKHFQEITPKATNESLRQLLRTYAKQAEKQAQILDDLCNGLFINKAGEECTMLGTFISESKSRMRRCLTSQIRDAVIILDTQHIIHYMIASFGACSTYARVLGMNSEANDLHELVAHEKEGDRLLAKLAIATVDKSAFNYRN